MLAKVEARLLDEENAMLVREAAQKLLRPLPYEIPSQMAENNDPGRAAPWD